MRVIQNERTHKETNGYFCREYSWDTSSIIYNQQSENGYIMQKIVRNTTASSYFWNTHPQKDAFIHSYYEAWPVVKGKIEYSGTQQEFDDRWVYSSKIPSWESLMYDYKDKYGTMGSVQMEGYVYWCNRGTKAAEDIHNRFKVGAIKWAGELLSSADFYEFSSAELIYRHDFGNEWDLRNDEDIVSALISKFKSTQLSKERALKDIDAFFKDTQYYNTLHHEIATHL